MGKILIIEDDEALNRGINFVLKKDNYEVIAAFDISTAKKLLVYENVDMIILDLNLPDGDGIDFCKELRQNSNIPVIMLTARDLETDEIIGFETGADDYITKPFSLSVLKARIASIFRRKSNYLKQTENIIVSNDITLNIDNVKVYKKEKELYLSSTEYKLLKYLVENKNRVVLKEQILNILWDITGNFVDDNTLAVNISRVRKKIEDIPATPKYIKTIHGMGYMWCEKDGY